MKIAMVGTGYVGLVTGACFADSGNDVACVDIDAAKVRRLTAGEIPIYEPGLAEIVRRNAAAGRLTFTTDLAAAVADASVVYLAVGTPQSEDGSADLSALWKVADGLARHLPPGALTVIKSTVPVGTNRALFDRLTKAAGRTCDVASNPEFLKEGAAIEDFMKPDRVVVGVRTDDAADLLRELYAPFLRTEKPFLVMSPESAELTKYAANAMLSTKISFINEMANLCQQMGGDINDVRRGMGHDRRIGFEFLFPGVGYGGSCFPKDVRALARMAESLGVAPRILEAVDAVNTAQKRTLIDRIVATFGEGLAGRTIGVWGLSFKPKTDDIREAPALVLIDDLLARGARLIVHDPEAVANVKALYGEELTYAAQELDALDGVDALAINTEWNEYRHPDFAAMRARMKTPLIFDGRNLYTPEQMARAGFVYHSIGRPAVTPA